MAKHASPRKFLICNVDEGDPGAYMNRNEMESDPHMLIEGMLIGAYAMGASEGIGPDAFRITSYNVCYTKLLRRCELVGP